VANIYKNSKVDLTTTDNTTVYTVPSDSRAIIKSILVSEDAGSGTTVTLTITDAASAVFNLFKDKSIASKVTTELLTHPLILQENEVLKAQAADANELHIVASILEINRE
jgi:CO dehydrogenase/acetyl-CoA synthase gamma subunit (corrinoid Fe-S protein)